MIRAFVPSKYYVAVSITGLWCELGCPYCRGRYLKGMVPALTPNELYNVAQKLWNSGARGILISGGFTKNGNLPLTKEYMKVIRLLKQELGVIISVHSGLVGKEIIDELWASQVDFIDFEIPPSNNYLKLMKNLPHHTKDMYLNLLSYTMDRYDKDFMVPHVVIESKASTVNEEKTTIKEIIEASPSKIVILVEIPPTREEHIDIERAIDVIRFTRNIFNREVILGCMRPQWIKRDLDSKVIEGKLIDRIATPKKTTIKKYHLEVIHACCSIPSKYINLFPRSMEA